MSRFYQKPESFIAWSLRRLGEGDYTVVVLEDGQRYECRSSTPPPGDTAKRDILYLRKTRETETWEWTRIQQAARKRCPLIVSAV